VPNINQGTLALVALDNASAVAEALGETSFELLIREFRRRVGEFARAADKTLEVAPDKFCVLLRGVAEDQQIELAGAKLKRLFDEPVTLVDQDVLADVRAAFVPPHTLFEDMDGRIRIAESGLREARRLGRGFVIRHELTTDLEQEVLRRTRDVETGLARGEFLLFFQPKVHAGFGTVVGAEGLMRWRHPRHGIQGPDQFLPLCGDTRMQRALSWLAVKSAIATCAGWPRSLDVAVNIPPAVVCDPELPVIVHDCLEIFGLAPQRLTIEVTEEAMLEDPDRAMAALRTLRELGVRISIDDFGTGYSSLSYLRALELDELKIDRSFVTDMLRNRRDRDIVKALIDLAHTFSMRVVAEGVEDAETAALLKQLDCDVLQGYHFGRAVPPREFLLGNDL
jgi:EAL domain-containing protein (putative c-di-GMP-specific phosphodiesterase class I)